LDVQSTVIAPFRDIMKAMNNKNNMMLWLQNNHVCLILDLLGITKVCMVGYLLDVHQHIIQQLAFKSTLYNAVEEAKITNDKVIALDLMLITTTLRTMATHSFCLLNSTNFQLVGVKTNLKKVHAVLTCTQVTTTSKMTRRSPECCLNLTDTIHSKGWKKAKERTASSLSGAHFGHYKARMFSKLINLIHMALSAIHSKLASHTITGAGQKVST